MAEIDFKNPPSPYGHPMRMVDRIDSLDIAAAKMVARKCVSCNEPLLQGHFPEFPILPGILQVEALLQTCSLLVKLIDGADIMRRAIISESRLKHMRPVLPGDTMMMEAQLVTRKDPFYTFRVRAFVDNEDAAKGQITLQWLDTVPRATNGVRG